MDYNPFSPEVRQDPFPYYRELRRSKPVSYVEPIGMYAIASAPVPLTYGFPFNDDPAQDLEASLTNLFYLNNWLHDRLARMGFDEPSGNFQEVNFSGLGKGNDRVRVDAQDGAGLNNANFGTPADGFHPRMQMFIWTRTNPNHDSGFDASVRIDPTPSP